MGGGRGAVTLVVETKSETQKKERLVDTFLASLEGRGEWGRRNPVHCGDGYLFLVTPTMFRGIGNALR